MTANGSGSRIRVFDESGEWIGTTYPKRAKGLVKNGRARRLAQTPNDDPDSEPDSIVLYRQSAGAETETAAFSPDKNIMNDTEDDMNEFDNKNNGMNENEIRIQRMIERFQKEMAAAREMAEKAAAEAKAALEEARAQRDAAERAGSGTESKTVCETLKNLGGKLNDAAETVAGDFRAAVADIAKNENVRETAETVKNAGEALIAEATKKVKEAEERLDEARRTYEEAEKQAKEAGADTDETGSDEDDLSRQVKENVRQIADEAGEAAKTAWTELKKGWKELSAASAGSFEWLKENTKDARESLKEAFREFSEGLKSVMNDVGDAGDGTEASGDEDGEEESSDRGIDIEWNWGPEDCEDEETCGPEDEPAEEPEKADADERAEAVRSARKSIEDEIEDVKSRIDGRLLLVKQKYDAGEITFEQYVEYTDKYSDYLHTRLTELREELKGI